MNRILTQPKLMLYFQRIARKLASRFGIDSNDIIQSFFENLLGGNHAEIEQVAFELVRREYKRGIVGVSEIPKDIDFDLIAKELKEKDKFLDSHEFVEYLYDLRKILNEKEYQLVVLHLAGFNKLDTYEATRGIGISKREFHKIWSNVLTA